MEDWFALVQHAFATLPRLDDEAAWLQRAGLRPAEWDLLLTAYLCEPPPSLDSLTEWLPYTSPALLQTQLSALREKNFLQALNEREYFLTDKAAELVETRVEQERALLSVQSSLPSRALQRLTRWLSRIVGAALAASPPPDKIRLLGNQRLAPPANASPMVLVSQYLTDLLCFHDDAYTTAWRAYGFDGPSIEVLTLLWRGEASDVEGLSAALSPRRGYSNQDYARVVARLQARALVQASGPLLTVTPSGCALREEIGTVTDRYFMFPWTVLLPVELRQLRELLQRFIGL